MKRRRRKKRSIKYVRLAVLLTILIVGVFVMIKGYEDYVKKMFRAKVKPEEVVALDIAKHQYHWERLIEIDGKRYYVYEDESYSKFGIDVSKHQKHIDWKKVKDSGVEFAMIRLGHRGYESGAISLDPTFKYNLKEAMKQGIQVGVYFFSQAITLEEAIEEAEFVLKHIKHHDLDFEIVFDMENIHGKTARIDALSNQQRTDFAIGFCQRVMAEDHKCMIYGNYHWLNGYFQLDRLANYPFWIAHYSDKLNFEYQLKMWQYTDSLTIDGIEGPVDANIYFDKEN